MDRPPYRDARTHLKTLLIVSIFCISTGLNQATANVLLTWNDVSWDLEKKSIFHEKKSLFQDIGSRRISSRWFEWTPLSETDFLKVDPPLPPRGISRTPLGGFLVEIHVDIWFRQSTGHQSAFQKMYKTYLYRKCLFWLAQIWPQHKSPLLYLLLAAWKTPKSGEASELCQHLVSSPIAW